MWDRELGTLSPPGGAAVLGLLLLIYSQGPRYWWEQAPDSGLATGHKLNLPDLPRRPLRSTGVTLLAVMLLV